MPSLYIIYNVPAIATRSKCTGIHSVHADPVCAALVCELDPAEVDLLEADVVVAVVPVLPPGIPPDPFARTVAVDQDSVVPSTTRPPVARVMLCPSNDVPGPSAVSVADPSITATLLPGSWMAVCVCPSMVNVAAFAKLAETVWTWIVLLPSTMTPL